MKKYVVVRKEIDKRDKRNKMIFKLFAVIIGLGMILPVVIQVSSAFISNRP